MMHTTIRATRSGGGTPGTKRIESDMTVGEIYRHIEDLIDFTSESATADDNPPPPQHPQEDEPSYLTEDTRSGSITIYNDFYIMHLYFNPNNDLSRGGPIPFEFFTAPPSPKISLHGTMHKEPLKKAVELANANEDAASYISNNANILNSYH